MSGDSTRSVARRLGKLEAQMKRGRAGGLGHSSFQGGGITQYDASGEQVVARYGEQFDGTSGALVLNGPQPPQPLPVALEAGTGGFWIRYQGTFVPNPQNGQAVYLPADFVAFRFHLGLTQDFLPSQENLRYTINDAMGGEIFVTATTENEWYVKVVCVSNAGRLSAPSLAAGPVRANGVSPEDLAFDLDDFAGTKIFYGPDEPVTDKANLWMEEFDPEFNPGEYRLWRYDVILGEWVEVKDKAAIDALAAAVVADGKANQAGIDALAANTAAGNAQTTANNAASAASGANTLAQQAKTAADSKITVFRQPSAPIGGNYKVNGDLWIDSDDGRIYVTTTTGGNWVESSDQRIATALTNAGTAQTTANSKTTVFAQISAPTTTGRTTGDVWIDTDDANKWYDWTGAWTVRLWAAGAISATARQLGGITVFRQATAPASGILDGDFWIDSDDNKIHVRVSGAWVASQDTAINTAITNAATAQATADGKMRIFPQSSAPTGLVAGDAGDMWIDTDDSNVTYTWSGTAWTKRQIGNGAIEPASLIASNVIATGTITAALLQAILVLTTTVVAGDPAGVHVRMTPTGFRVYRIDPDTGLPEEVARLGTETNDYFGIIDTDGLLVASIDDTGAVNARTANFREDITVAGESVSAKLMRTGRGKVGGWGGNIANLEGQTGTGIRFEYGIASFSFPVTAGRAYLIFVDGPEFYFTTGGDGMEAVLRLRVSTTGTVTIPTSPVIREWYVNGWKAGMWRREFRPVIYQPSHTGVASVGLTIEGKYWTDNTQVVRIPNGAHMKFDAIDIGPAGPNTAGEQSAMGASLYGGAPAAPPPVSKYQYNTDWMAPAGWKSFTGSGVQRNDVSGPVQGWDPSGYNGDGYGYWWWNLPSISGTVDEVWVWLYSSHWYYNSGGTARLYPIDASGQRRQPSPYDVGGFPKPGSLQVNISGWKDLFHNSQGSLRSIGVQVGQGGGTNLAYYGKFDGPSARLLIKYTQ